MHLHYTQLADGAAVRIAFDGTLINTHAGNMASWNTWGTCERGEAHEHQLPAGVLHGLHAGRQPATF